MSELKHHAICDMFPYMGGAEAESFNESVAKGGVAEPIILWNGLLVDGKNRLRAAEKAGIPFDSIPKVELDCNEEDMLQRIARKNLDRRNLTSSQRAAIAVELEGSLREAAAKRKEAGLKAAHESRKNSGNDNGRTIATTIKGKKGKKKGLLAQERAKRQANKSLAQAAKLTNTNARYVQGARKVREASPEMHAKVKSGEVSLPQARAALNGKPVNHKKKHFKELGSAIGLASRLVDKLAKMNDEPAWQKFAKDVKTELTEAYKSWEQWGKL